MRLAIAKPDWGITGGFELALDRVVQHLSEDGHDVRYLSPAVPGPGHHPYGQAIDPAVWERQPEYFRYLAMVDVFSGLHADQADVLISTQPPSFVVRHPRHLGIFYHHLRAYYDLAPVILEAGLAQDRQLHGVAAHLIREIDDRLLAGVGWILAGSEDVQARLASYNGRTDRVSVFHAALVQDLDVDPSAPPRDGHVLCVSRHEFPKRTELFVHAMKFLPSQRGVSVGEGGRLGYAQQLDRELNAAGEAAQELDSRPLWCCNPGWIAPDPTAGTGSNVTFLGAVSAHDLSRGYRDALCVVAPAHREDYGLTALEAMAAGRPVIVCEDGGGLLGLVEDGVTGLVVPPEGRAVAAAVERLRDDPTEAAAMGEAGRAVAATFTWSRAMGELRSGLEAVSS